MRLLMALVLALTVGVVVHVRDQHVLGQSEKQSVVERQKLTGRIVELEGEVSSLRRDVDDRDERLAQAADRDRARQVRSNR